MKLMHLGDLHLGKSLGDFDLNEDQKYILDQILGIIDEREVDGILIAGDVYDRAVPSESATNLLDYFLKCLADKKVKTFMISGNHDSDDRLNYGSSLFAANHIYISAQFMGNLYRQTVIDEHGEADIYLLPFVKASQVRHFYPEEKIESYDDAVRTILAHAQIDPGKRNILVAHQFVAGKGADPELGGSESAGTQSVGLVEKIGYDCFDGFDYVALGHIHSPQSVGRKEVRYSGSPLKYSLSEVGNDKSVPVITLGEKGDVDIELVKLRPMRDMRHLKGPIEKLLNRENITSPEDFIYATLTNEDIIDDAMGILQQVYPNTVKIDYDNSRTREIDRIDIANIAEQKSFDELIGDFYRKMYGCDISEEEMQVMKEAAKEAGVIDETD
ncbi:MAG: exonuclease SbcCD subunit D [Lachnospiraceae bacterium]|nr:exonuclease SbcCD subunit D [Lachnospiraceae bacterium]